MKFKIKNKKAQATLEFVMCLPIVLLLVLGTVDIARICIIRLETTAIMQQEISNVASGLYQIPGVNTGSVTESLRNKIQKTSFFNTSFNSPSSGNSKSPMVNTVIKGPTPFGGKYYGSATEIHPGTTICLEATSSYKPVYSEMLKIVRQSGGEIKVHSKACSVVETNLHLNNSKNKVQK